MEHPSAKYDRIGRGYRRFRKPDARIASAIWGELGEAMRIVNVGAGSGSYEPPRTFVVAVEPSETMLRQREPASARVVRARAEDLPFGGGSFDAAMAVLTTHHWTDWREGLGEMRRVAARVVVLTWDPAHPGFWLTRDYFPDILAEDRSLFPSLGEVADALGGADVRPVEIPGDCSDGFLGAYWRRPEAYLDEAARGAISSFQRLRGVGERIERLARDLNTGRWDRRHGRLRRLSTLDLGYRLVSHPPRDGAPLG